MRRLCVALALSAAAASLSAAIPKTAEGWYTPESGFETWSMTSTWSQGKDKSGKCEAYFDNAGGISVQWQDDAPSGAVKVAFENALIGSLQAERNKESIAALGENLNAIGLSSGIKVTATDPNGGTHTYTLKFGKGTLQQTVNASDQIEVEDPSASYNIADEVTLHWNAKNKVELFRSANAYMAKDEWWSDNSGFYVPFLKPNQQLDWKWHRGVDNLSLAKDPKSGRLELCGWNEGPTANFSTLADALAKEGKGTFEDYRVVVRGASKGLAYVDLGTLATGGSPVDGVSITTNAADGASSDGVASLFNFASQEDCAIPYKYNGKLFWKTPDRWTDGASLEWFSDSGGNGKWQVAGAADYAGRHAKHYFGTSVDDSASLGWHELPNVTTNCVVGDEVTVSTNPSIPGRVAVEGEKLVGLKGWNYGYRGLDPLFVVNSGGGVGYIPLPALTNLAACACTGKWESVVSWIGNEAELNDAGGLTLPGESADDFLKTTLGFVYSTTPADLHFTNDEDKFEASFGPPTNWADGKSVALTEDKKALEVKGFTAGAACSASVSKMLSDPAGSDAQNHLMLARYDDGTGPVLHYVKLGDGVLGGSPPDGKSVTTNATLGAAADGEISLYGWASAEEGKVPVKRSGVLAWEDAGTPPDGKSLVTVDVSGEDGATAKQMAIKGFAEAGANTMPYKTEGGTLLWGALSGTNTVILAGAGINVTANGEGAITISAQALSDSPTGSSEGGETASLTVVTAVRYDEETHKFQQKSRTISFKGSVGDESEWTDVFEAVSHKSEHEAEVSE